MEVAVIYTGKVDICGIDTSKLPRLKDKETAELLRKARAGDNSARTALIQGKLFLIGALLRLMK